jgi:hypothetical protein
VRLPVLRPVTVEAMTTRTADVMIAASVTGRSRRV